MRDRSSRASGRGGNATALIVCVGLLAAGCGGLLSRAREAFEAGELERAEELAIQREGRGDPGHEARQIRIEIALARGDADGAWTLIEEIPPEERETGLQWLAIRTAWRRGDAGGWADAAITLYARGEVNAGELAAITDDPALAAEGWEALLDAAPESDSWLIWDTTELVAHGRGEEMPSRMRESLDLALYRLVSRGDFDAARRHLERLRERDGVEAFLLRKHEAALEVEQGGRHASGSLEALLLSEPERAEAIATEYLERGLCDAAASAWNWLAGQRQGEERVGALLQEAEALYCGGRRVEARESLGLALREATAPGTAVVRGWVVAERSGDSEAYLELAVVALDRIACADEETDVLARAELSVARALGAAGRTGEAIARLDARVRECTDAGVWATHAGILFEDWAEWDDAIRMLRIALDARPDDERALTAFFRLPGFRRQSGEAGARAQAYVDSKRAEGLLDSETVATQVLDLLGRYSLPEVEAVERDLLEWLVEEYPERWTFVSDLASALEEEGQRAESAELIERYLRNTTSRVNGELEVGQWLARRAGTRQQAETILAPLTMDPEAVASPPRVTVGSARSIAEAACLLLVDVRGYADNRPGVRQALERFAELRGEAAPETWETLLSLYGLGARLDGEGIVWLMRGAIEAGAGSATVWRQLGETLLRLDDEAGGVDALAEAIALDPAMAPDVLDALVDSGRVASALDVLDRYTLTWGDDAFSRSRTARLLSQIGETVHTPRGRLRLDAIAWRAWRSYLDSGYRASGVTLDELREAGFPDLATEFALRQIGEGEVQTPPFTMGLVLDATASGASWETVAPFAEMLMTTDDARFLPALFGVLSAYGREEEMRTVLGRILDGDGTGTSRRIEQLRELLPSVLPALPEDEVTAIVGEYIVGDARALLDPEAAIPRRVDGEVDRRRLAAELLAIGARVALVTGRWEEARSFATEALSAGAPDLLGLMETAFQALSRSSGGDPPPDALEAVVGAAGGMGETWLLAATLLHAQGLLEAATYAYGRVAGDVLVEAEAQAGLGAVLAESGQTDRATEVWSGVIAFLSGAPESERTRLAVASRAIGTLVEAGRPDLAADFARQSVDFAPEEHELALMLAWNEIASGDRSGGLRRIRDLAAEWPLGLPSIATVLLREGEAPLAMELWEAEAAQLPDDVRARLGETLAEPRVQRYGLDDTLRFIDELRDPDDETGVEEMLSSMLLSDAGRGAEAIREHRQLPSWLLGTGSQVGLISAYASLGADDEVDRLIAEIARSLGDLAIPGDPTALYAIVEVLVQSGRTDRVEWVLDLWNAAGGESAILSAGVRAEWVLTTRGIAETVDLVRTLLSGCSADAGIRGDIDCSHRLEAAEEMLDRMAVAGYPREACALAREAGGLVRGADPIRLAAIRYAGQLGDGELALALAAEWRELSGGFPGHRIPLARALRDAGLLEPAFEELSSILRSGAPDLADSALDEAIRLSLLDGNDEWRERALAIHSERTAAPRERLRAQADSLLAAYEPALAAPLLELLAEIEPGNTDAWEEWFDALVLAGDGERVAHELSRLWERVPAPAEFLEERIETLAADPDPVVSLAATTAWEELRPANAGARTLRIEALADAGHCEAAGERARALIEDAHWAPETARPVAEAFTNTECAAVGLALAEEVLSHDIRMGDAFVLIAARLALEAGELGSAHAILLAGAEQTVDAVEWADEAGEIALDAGRPDLALRFAETALGEAPASPAAWATRGNALAAMGDLDGAIAAWERYAADAGDAYAGLGEIVELLASSGEPERALPFVRRLASVTRVGFSDSVWATQWTGPGLALAAWSAADPADALAWFEAALPDSIDRPAWSGSLYSLSQAWEDAGETLRALDAYEQLQLRFPGSAIALNGGAYARSTMRVALDDGERMARRSLVVDADLGFARSYNVLDTLAWVHFAQGRADVAVGELLLAVRMAIRDPDVGSETTEVLRAHLAEALALREVGTGR